MSFPSISVNFNDGIVVGNEKKKKKKVQFFEFSVNFRQFPSISVNFIAGIVVGNRKKENLGEKKKLKKAQKSSKKLKNIFLNELVSYQQPVSFLSAIPSPFRYRNIAGSLPDHCRID
jgi:hypothetical protein